LNKSANENEQVCKENEQICKENEQVCKEKKNEQVCKVKNEQVCKRCKLLFIFHPMDTFFLANQRMKSQENNAH